MTARRDFIRKTARIAAAITLPGAPAILRAQNRKLRFGVGPLLPTAEDTKKAYTPFFTDRKSTRLNSSHSQQSRMPSSA